MFHWFAEDRTAPVSDLPLGGRVSPRVDQVAVAMATAGLVTFIWISTTSADSFFSFLFFFFPRRNKWRRSSIDARAKPQTNSDGSHLHNQISSCGQWENVPHKVHSDSHFGTFFFFSISIWFVDSLQNWPPDVTTAFCCILVRGSDWIFSVWTSKVWTNVIGTWPGKRHGPEVSAPVRERNIKTCGCAEKGHLFWPTEPE